jgi:DNA-binding response OmpR family regulator
VARLLLAEDDDGIRVPLARALEREGYVVDAVADGTSAARMGEENDYALIVLDIGLPGVDGLEVCRRVRRANADVPIMFLTAQDSELDAVAGLDAGADDYVTKPFGLAELMARVRAQVRRSAPDLLPMSRWTPPRAAHGRARASSTSRRRSSTCSSCSSATPARSW